MWLWSMLRLQPVQSSTMLSEATIANSHKAYFNKFFNNDSVLIYLHTQDINRVYNCASSSLAKA